ncbi:hypothetical protein ACLOJK_035188 [Asimina triloba]
MPKQKIKKEMPKQKIKKERGRERGREDDLQKIAITDRARHKKTEICLFDELLHDRKNTTADRAPGRRRSVSSESLEKTNTVVFPGRLAGEGERKDLSSKSLEKMSAEISLRSRWRRDFQNGQRSGWGRVAREDEHLIFKSTALGRRR